jgi:hypothetical protein
MYKKLLLITAVVLASGCTDKLTVSALNGTYTGQFYYLEPGKSSNDLVTAPASISFSDKHYTSQGQPNRIPAGGLGTFEIEENDLLNFREQNVWTANFDWGLILNGKYTYEIKGDSLILDRYIEPCPSCTMTPGTYQYRLKRSN